MSAADAGFRGLQLEVAMAGTGRSKYRGLSTSLRFGRDDVRSWLARNSVG